MKNEITSYDVKDKVTQFTKAGFRQDAMSQGAYDGRFRPRVIKSGKVYSRPKNKSINYV